MASEIKVDTVSEKTSANGVTIDGVNIKDSKIVTANSVDSDVYVDGSIDTAHIADLNVTTGKIAADAITSAKIADDAIDSEHYTNGSIDTAHIAADQIVASLIADDAINSEHYTDGSIDTAHIADGNVTIAKINIPDGTELSAAPATGDELLIYDASASANRSINVANFLKASSVIQYVIATNSAEGTNGTTTFNSTGLTLDITPTNASSKMVIIAQDSYKTANDGSTNASGREAIFCLFQDTSQLNDTKATVGRTEIAASTSATPTALGTVTLIGTQAAGNTSERTYTLKVKTNGAAVVSFNESGHDSFMIALELYA